MQKFRRTQKLVYFCFLLVIGLCMAWGIDETITSLQWCDLGGCSTVNASREIEIVEGLNALQKQYFLKNGDFADSRGALRSISFYYNPDLAEPTMRQYRTRVAEKTAFSYGVSRLSEYESYVGAVFVKKDEAGNIIFDEILCEANFFGREFWFTMPTPIDRNGVLACGRGSREFRS